MTDVPTDRDARVELRPAWSAYTTDVRSRSKWMLPIVLLLVGRFALSGSSLGWIVVTGIGTVAAIGVVLLLVRLYIRSTRVILSPGRIERYGALTRDLVLEVDELRGVSAVVVQPAGANVMVVLRDEAVGTIRLSDAVWSTDDLATIAAHAGVPYLTDTASAAEIDKIVPGSMPLYLRRPYLWGIAVALLLFALVVAGVLAWFVANDLPPFDEHPPAAASASAIELQDAAAAAIITAIPGEWSEPVVQLRECEVSDGKGWSREVVVTRDGGSPIDPADMDEAGRALAALGLVSTAVTESGDQLVIDADGGDPYQYLSLWVTPAGAADVWIDGSCDVPAD